MRISCNVIHEDPLTAGLISKRFSFPVSEVKFFEPSEDFENCTTITFYDDSVIDAIISFQDLEALIPSDHKWYQKMSL